MNRLRLLEVEKRVLDNDVAAACIAHSMPMLTYIIIHYTSQIIVHLMIQFMMNL